jgi:Flp pilus assembly protein CpaB
MALRANSLKNRKKNRGNLLASALLSFALVFAAFLINRKSAKVEAAVNPAMIVAQYDTIILPVPVESVAAGTKVKDIRFKNVAFPKQQVPEGAINNIDTFLEASAIAPLPANLPLFAKNLSLTAFSTNPVVEKIPPGMRAMTIKVDATSSVEGWAGSGNTVDVLLIEKDRTSVVAEMVKILSAERSVSPVEGSAAHNVPTTVTLLVTQEQCLAINTAIPLGRIAFALRSGQDTEKWTSPRFTSDSLRGSAVLKDQKGIITGFVSTTDSNRGQIPNKDRKAYALSDGKWIATEIVPEGFFDKDVKAQKELANAEN